MRQGDVSRRSFVKGLAASPLLGNLLSSQSLAGAEVKRVGSTAERLKAKPYEKRVCRVENYPSCLMPEESYIGLSVEEYVELIHEAGLEVQIVAGEIDRGTPRFRSKMLPPRPDVDRDRLPQFLKLAHEKGILVLAYYPMIYTKPLRKIHPEWLMRFLDDGRPKPENLGWFCFNSPYRDWLARYLIEYLDNLDLDGFYFDDMNWGSHEDWPFTPSCCCEYCEKLFKEETGFRIPAKVDFGSLDFKHFVNWRYEKTKGIMAYLTQQVKAKYPDAVLDFNYYGRHKADWSLGHPINPLGLEKVGAYFFAETNPVEDGSSFTAKVARAHGSPFAIWRHAVQTLPEVISSSAPEAEPLSPTLHGLAALANGGAAFYGMFDGPIVLRKNLMKAIFQEAKKRADYMDGETVKYVALHHSQQTRDFYSSPTAQYGLRVTKGVFEILNQSQLLVDIVFDEQLKRENLSAYRVLFLSNSACLSDRQVDEIRTFVAQGGTLIATHETSLLDELGQKRSDFLLSDVLGVNYHSTPKGAVRGIVYVPQELAISREFGYVICFAGEESLVSLRPGSKVEVICTRSNLTGKSPLDKFDSRKNYDSSEPAVTLNRFGKGKAIYINGDVGAAFIHNPYPPLKRLVAQLVRRTKPPIEIEAPRAIEVTAALRGPREMVIHLVNNPAPSLPFGTRSQDVTTHFYLEEVNPIYNVRIKLNDFKLRGASLPLQARALPIAHHPVGVLVPEVKLHEVVLLELEG
ncbi:MAG: hypothetical protein FJW26_02360 [Acidimicrobiia bacterium]|nr:hypothetical protein [Acidimicrobiia bacterium]